MAKTQTSWVIAGMLLLAVPASAQQVGVTSAVSPQAQARQGTAPLRVVKLGDNVLHDQHFQTDANGVVQILLVDGSSFTVGPRSSLTIDEFVYDPDKGTAKVVASAGRGVMRFIGGAASKPGGSAAVKTPVGVAGIRGAIVDFSIPEGSSGQMRIDMPYGELVALACQGGEGGSLSTPGTSMLIGISNGECDTITYAQGLAALNPGGVASTAPGAGAPMAQADIPLMDDPSGLAGFSGAPMVADWGYFLHMPGDLQQQQFSEQQTVVRLLEAIAQQPAEPPAPPPVLRYSGTYSGFSSSMSEAGLAQSPGNVQMVFDPLTGSVSASIQSDQWDGQAWSMTGSPGSYQNDTQLGGSNGNGQFSGATALSQLCDCDYLAWGQWSASGIAPAMPAPSTSYTASMGYWIVGQLLPAGQLPIYGSATYTGTVFGVVNSAGQLTNGVSGALSATVDFASGLGSLSIANFGGRSFGDANLDINASPLSGGGFSGTLSDGANLSGQYQAGFSNGVAAMTGAGLRSGILPASTLDTSVSAFFGSFGVIDGNWSASGVFAGTRGLMEASPEPPTPARRHYEGTYYGFSAGMDMGNRAQMPGDVVMTFDSTAGTVAARVSPRQWEGASWELDAADGQYRSDDVIVGRNAHGQLTAAANRALLCDCDYLVWGTWDGDAGDDLLTYPSQRGYWVAGQLLTPVQLPVYGVATYSGQVLGTVSRAGILTPDVTGGMTAQINFGTGLGSLWITNFDGRSFGDDALDIAASPRGEGGFSGELSGSSTLSGWYSAGFANVDAVDGSAHALFGSFGVSEGDWSASGLFAGTRGGLENPPPQPEPESLRYDGLYRGMTSSIEPASSADFLGDVDIHFDAAAATFTASLWHPQWDGLSWNVSAAESRYTSDTAISGSNADGWLVAAQDPRLLCDCDYLVWGRWEARVPSQWEDSGFDQRDGYWIAGQPMAMGQLPVSGVAHYQGTVLGQVQVDGIFREDVSGSFSLGMDFGSGRTSFWISDLDGSSFGGDGWLDSDGDDARFSGGMGSDEGFWGTYSGFLASSNGATASHVFGSFHFDDQGWGEAYQHWSVHGIFAGSRGDLITPHFSGEYRGFHVYRDATGALEAGHMVLDLDPVSGAVSSNFWMKVSGGAEQGWQSLAVEDAGYRGSAQFSIETAAGNLQTADDPALLCDCDYLAWGTWNYDLQEFVAEEGLWIVGALSEDLELDYPSLVNAAYTGVAMGYVDGSTAPVYGNFQSAITFSEGTGSWTVSNFDGREFGAEFSLNDSLYWSGNTTYGAEGNFEAGLIRAGNDPIGAMIGSFNVIDNGWSAAGIFAGER